MTEWNVEKLLRGYEWLNLHPLVREKSLDTPRMEPVENVRLKFLCQHRYSRIRTSSRTFLVNRWRQRLLLSIYIFFFEKLPSFSLTRAFTSFLYCLISSRPFVRHKRIVLAVGFVFFRFPSIVSRATSIILSGEKTHTIIIITKRVPSIRTRCTRPDIVSVIRCTILPLNCNCVLRSPSAAATLPRVDLMRFRTIVHSHRGGLASPPLLQSAIDMVASCYVRA